MFLIIFTSIYAVSAAPSVGTFVISDADGVIDFGTTYTFNVTTSGISNKSTDNITACVINGVSMVGPGGNGTGLWQVNTTVDSFTPNMAKNCTYTTVTVTCTQINGSTITTSNSSWSAYPCVHISSGLVTAATSTSTALTLTTSYFTSLHGKTNITPEVSASRIYCDVICMTSRGNITAKIKAVTYNTSHNYCPFDCRDISNTGIMVQQAGYLTQTAPETAFPTAVMVTIFGFFGVGAGYLFSNWRRGGRKG